LTSGFARDGWTGQATPVEGGLVRCDGCGAPFPAADVGVDALARVEGASDPADEAVVIAVTCPGCSSRSVLVLSYGMNAEIADADVLLALPDPPAPGDPGVS
jgi:hypothetical protein